MLAVIAAVTLGALTTAAPRDSAPPRVATAVRIAAIGADRDSARLVEPAGVVADAFGRVYVTDAATHRLHRYDARGNWIGESGALGSDPGRLRRPGAVARLGALNVAVLDRENRRVVAYDLFGRRARLVAVFGDPPLADPLGRVDPQTLAADPAGTLYVVDPDRERLIALDPDGRLLRTIGGYGEGPGAFRGLAAVAVGKRGELWTAERSGRIQRLDADGRPIQAFRLPLVPGAIAVDDSGRVAVADAAAGTVWIGDVRGAALARVEGLAGPQAVAFAPDGTLLVAESGAGRVARYALPPRRAGE